jgi:hypothetical protein
MMNAQTLASKTKTNQPSGMLNWMVRPAPQTYTYENITGDLADEISAALASSKALADPIRDVEPKDFEAAYQWFYS